MSYWIIQDKIFGEETDLLTTALKDNNIKYSVIQSPAEFYTTGFKIFRGSIDFVEICKGRHEKWNTIKWYVDNFSCSKYYHLFGAHSILLNFDAVWMPWGHFKLFGDRLFDDFECGSLFIRPDSGRKIFTGTTVRPKWFEKECETIESLPSTMGLNDETMILVSPGKDIEKEARFLLGPTGIISSSWYNNEGTQKEMDTMATYALDTYSPKLFGDFMTVDMCYIRNDILPHIVEVNSFESAGLYDMDYNKIVRAVEDYAIQRML